MTRPAFPSHIATALNRLTVPPLPQGFSDRLVARIDAGDLPSDGPSVTPPLPTARRAFGGTGWRRSGRIVTIAAAFGLATATAAASGFFGKPVYVPVVSDALAKAQLVELPSRKEPKAAPRPVAANDSKAAITTETQPSPNGRQAVRELYRRLHSDSEFQSLPRQEKLAIARREIQAMLDKGEATIPELRRAFVEHRALQNPVVRQRIKRELVRRGLQKQGSDEAGIPVRGGEVVAGTVRQPGSVAAQSEARRDAFRRMPADQQARIRDLREQLRTASPTERRAIRQELRTIRQSQQNAPVEEKIETAGEGNADVAR
ncbi:MAG: hypothetical protein IPG54_06610 [Sphingomonadales bacterium]|jgi:hypothetical protein|nr:hypothetical protein [Sphingomonadales bacterium]MBK9002553.1 hypothetical protein [Sphingomonadales bacterium]MBK9267773.1 hypothetical protein [Sphingomonadales bacterium]MBP6433449.1 hypothetical protein [Sphingorhabdus sp.]